METTELNKIFDVKYGNKFDANKMKFVNDGSINFVSRNSKNNGCVGSVKKYNNTIPYKANLITVSLGGSFLLSSFIQPKKFYTAQNIAILIPKTTMNFKEKLFYCKCISMNRFKYSAFGREANKTLKILKVPKEIPDWINKTKILNLTQLTKPFSYRTLSLNIFNWKEVKLKKIFDIMGSKTTSKKVLKRKGIGKYPYITTQSKNNGVGGFYNIYTEKGNILVIDSAVKGHCTYQSENFTASDHVEKLVPKFEMNVYVAMFLTKLINLEQYRYSYGRKLNQERIKNTVIKLPFKDNKPDWNFIESYIKSLKFSSTL